MLKFPDDYPTSPPQVLMAPNVKLPHPNVFSSFGGEGGHAYICLNMLNAHTNGQAYSGWSTAYSVLSILLQLSAFFFDVRVEQETYGMSNTVQYEAVDQSGAAVQQARIQMAETVCKCGHCPAVSFPPLPKQDDNTVTNRRERRELFKAKCEASCNSGVSLTHLPSDMVMEILQLPSMLPQSIHALRRTCASMRNIIGSFRVMERREIRCFFTRLGVRDAVIGVGVGRHLHRDGTIARLDTEMDLLSHNAFLRHGVRHSVWGFEFSHFLPLYVCDEHGQRDDVKRATAQCILALATPAALAAPLSRELKINDILNVLPKLMNSAVVSLMMENENNGRAVSEKALEGYCSTHHLLLGLAKRYPAVQTRANDMVRSFLTDADARTKEA